MSKKPFVTTLAVLLTITLVAPAVFFITPQRASAASGSCIGGLLGGVGGYIVSMITGAVPSSDTATQVGTGATAGATIGTCINDLIIVPTLRQMIRSMLKSITNSTINWINGTGNPTGQPSYVRNLPGHLQSVGDSAAFAFIAKISTGFNSPFGSAISLALYKNYFQQTSLAGFFGANKSTLPGSRQSQQSFLAGNWSQGGVGTWFALTTQTQNNPYTLYQTAQSQLGSNVSQVQTNRRQDLMQSGGFLSFCNGTKSGAIAGPANNPDEQTALQACRANGGSESECYIESGGLGQGRGINPQASCTNADGTPAEVTTPGSTISSYLQANVNSGIGQLVSAQDLDSAISQVVMALGNKVLGSTGLFGSSQTSSSKNTTVVTTAPSSASVSAVSLAETTLSNITAYTNAWQTIAAVTNTASTSVDSLAKFCTTAADKAALDITSNNSNEWNTMVVSVSQNLATMHSVFIAASRKQATDAQTALATEIAPVLAQVKAVPNAIGSTKVFALKVQAEATAIPIADPVQFSTDVATLTSMPPSVIDVINAQQNAQAFGAAQANPVESLNVSGGSLVDQMNLLNTNAATLKTTVCNPASELYTGPITG